jgi:hypothetical protein
MAEQASFHLGLYGRVSPAPYNASISSHRNCRRWDPAYVGELEGQGCLTLAALAHSRTGCNCA